MDTSFKFLPDAASTNAAGVDHLAIFVLLVCTFFTVLVAVLVIYFAIHFRRKGPPPEPKEDSHKGLALELTWSIIPAILMAVFFIAGAKVYLRATLPPKDSLEIDVIGKQWMWKIEHPTGAREIDELHIPIDTPIKLNMISQDVIHDFAIPAFRIKQDVIPGRYTSEWFQATKLGEYHLFCDQYCGNQHAGMIGKVVVMDKAKYQQWLDGSPLDDAPQVAGEKLFAQYGCVVCHATRAPTMAGLYGRRVQLEGGGIVVADDTYLRESILNPSAKVVASYPPVMPSFKGQLTEEQVMELIAYIKSMAGATSEKYELSPQGPATQPTRATPGPKEIP